MTEWIKCSDRLPENNEISIGKSYLLFGAYVSKEVFENYIESLNEFCEDCKNEKVACVCMEESDYEKKL